MDHTLPIIILGVEIVYFLGNPVRKGRLIFLKEIELMIMVFTLICTFATFTSPILYIGSFLIALLIYRSGTWLIIGAPLNRIENALARAVVATRSELERNEKDYTIDSGMSLRLFGLANKSTIVKFSSKSPSKKAILTKTVFRKFVENYSLKVS